MVADLTVDSARNRLVSSNTDKLGAGTEYRLVCDALGRLIVSAIAWPLPAGGATAANQVIIEATLTNLEEALQSIGTDHLLIGDAGSIINLDAAGDVQVDVLSMPVVAVTGTFWQATQPVSGTFWQATQPISAAALPLPAGAATEASLVLLEATLTNLEEALQSIGTDYLLIGDAGAIINLDANGDVQVDVLTMPVVAVTGTFWQATQPVSGTFWQATQPISAAALPLPTGASTSAIQTTMNTSLNNIETDAAAIEVLITASNVDLAAIEVLQIAIDASLNEIEDAIENLEESLASVGTDYLLIGDAGAIINLDANGDVQVDVLTMPVVAVTGTFWQATQPVSAAALPLPTGAATSANQTTVIGHLNALDDALQSIGTDYLLIGDAGSIINLDAAGDVQVDILSSCAIAVTGTFWQATQPVSGTFWQATQPISAVALPLPAGAATEASVQGCETALQLIDNALQSINTDYLLIGDVGSIINLDANGDVQVDILSSCAIAVTGTFWQVTQPISAAALPLPTGAATSANQTTIAGYLNALDDALQSIGTDYLLIGDAGSIINLDAGGDVQVDVKTMPVVAVTGTFWQVTQPVSGTFWQATQPISAAALPLPAGAATEASVQGCETALQLIDTVGTPSDAFANPSNILETMVFLMGWDSVAGNWERLKTNASGALKIAAA